jgi:Malectin domain
VNIDLLSVALTIVAHKCTTFLFALAPCLDKFSFWAPGQRKFDVDVEGTAVNDIDVIQIGGQANKAITRLITVTVNDGQLSIEFKFNIPKVTSILNVGHLVDHRGLDSPACQTTTCDRWTIPRSQALR